MLASILARFGAVLFTMSNSPVRALAAMRGARTLRDPALRATHAVLHGVVDLLLNRAFPRPARCHVRLLRSDYPIESRAA